MSIRKKIPLDVSLYMRLLHQEKNSQFVSLGRDIQVIVDQAYIDTVKKTFQAKRLTKGKPIKEEESR